MVDNALSPHGGTIVERLEEPAKAKERIKGLPQIPIRSPLAREVMSIGYGYFSPLEGFMTRADVDSVVNKMTLASGYVWSIPIVFDIEEREIQELGVKQGDTLLLTYEGNPLATLDIEEIFSYDLDVMSHRDVATCRISSGASAMRLFTLTPTPTIRTGGPDGPAAGASIRMPHIFRPWT